MGPANNLSYLLHHVSTVLDRQVDQVLQQELGIGLSQFKILMVLEWNPRVKQRSIAASLGQTEASVSRQIKLLRSKALLEAKTDPQNRRKHITAPTPKGMQLTEAATAILRRNLGPELGDLNQAQLVQLTDGLQRLHRSLCKPGRPGACDHQLVG